MRHIPLTILLLLSMCATSMAADSGKDLARLTECQGAIKSEELTRNFMKRVKQEDAATVEPKR